MYIYIQVCVYIYIHIYIHTQTYTYTCTHLIYMREVYMYLYIDVSMYLCVCLSTCVYNLADSLHSQFVYTSFWEVQTDLHPTNHINANSLLLSPLPIDGFPILVYFFQKKKEEIIPEISHWIFVRQTIFLMLNVLPNASQNFESLLPIS